MDYKKHYELLCKRGQQRIRQEGTYYEKHHIIPKCKGGSDLADNITVLTAREHYIAHFLLHMMYPNDRSLWFALFCMAFLETEGQRRYLIGSRTFERLKKERGEKQDITASLKNLEKAVLAIKGKKREKSWNEKATNAWIQIKGKCTKLTREEMLGLLEEHNYSASEISKHTEYSIQNVIKGCKYHNIPYKKKDAWANIKTRKHN